MPRAPRIDVAGRCYHVLNRANARFRMFRKDGDFEAFERVLAEAVDRSAGAVELFAYCIMGNHWHLVLRTREDRAMGAFMKWLTTTHAGRYRVAHGQEGIGHLYQGRYKSFMIEDDAHFLTVCRYVERNAARASLVERAEDWRWGSLQCWREGDAERRALLRPWPAGVTGVKDAGRYNRPRGWLRTVNTPISGAELDALRVCAQRGRPYGGSAWVEKMVAKYGLEATVRGPGRPRRG